jgi:uncharacterized protein (TIGR03663 family)
MEPRAERRLYCMVAIAALALGAWLRLPNLAGRPMHCDEAVHVIKLNTLWQTGRYVYDPSEYHGPTLYYATLPLLWLSGERAFTDFRESTLRLTPVLFGVGLIGVTLLLSRGVGRAAAACAGVLTAASPMFVYYSRYYIQEMLLVFFSAALLACGWRFLATRRLGWALAAGAALGLMHATKETCLIAWGCMGLALAATAWQLRPATGGAAWGRYGVRGIAGLGLAALVSVSLFSAFFTNPSGPLDSIRTYATYFERAGNHGLHDHPWSFYWVRLLYAHFAAGPTWSEAFIAVLAVVGGWVSLRGAESLRSFIAIYTLAMATVYTLIPYKTPWCALGFWHGAILLAGVGAAHVLSMTRGAARAVVLLALVAGGVHLATQARQATSDKFSADNRNPYVYAHPLRGIVDLAASVRTFADLDASAARIQIIADDYWPLPWYLRDLDVAGRVGWWDALPPARQPIDAPILIVGAEWHAELEPRLRDSYRVSRHGLRPGTALLLLVEQSRYDAFVRSQKSADD